MPTTVTSNGDGQFHMQWGWLAKIVAGVVVTMLGGGLIQLFLLYTEVKVQAVRFEARFAANEARLESVTKVLDKHLEWANYKTDDVDNRLDDLEGGRRTTRSR